MLVQWRKLESSLAGEKAKANKRVTKRLGEERSLARNTTEGAGRGLK